MSAVGAAGTVLAGDLFGMQKSAVKTAANVEEAKLTKNCSNFNGLQIGAITYSYRSQGETAGDMLLFALQSGVGSVELMSSSALEFTGSPAFRDPNSPEGKECLRKFAILGDLYRKAGVDIHILKYSPKAEMTDSELDYVFEACKAIGADGLTTELDLEVARKAGPFAEKHGKYLIFHNHGQPADTDFPGFDEYLKFNRNIMLNFDAGHYFGFTGKNPCEVIEKYHDRIYSIHLKDKNSPTHPTEPNRNQPWGQGETPLKEILTLVQKNCKKADWPNHCDIELEYSVPENSTSAEEVAKCVAYCRDILTK